MSEPFRSAVPLAAAGIICLGLVPTLGGPDRPLHWAMTAGMVGFGVLLQIRHRLRRSEGPLAQVPSEVARRAGFAMLGTVGVIAALMVGIVIARWNPRSEVAGLSIVLPALGLLWLTIVGFRVLRLRFQPAALEEKSPAEAPSRRPSNWDNLSGARSSRGKATGSHASL